MTQPVAVVTGSNKGIGFAVIKALCKKFAGVVYLTARNTQNGEQAVKELNAIGLYPKFHQLDISERESVDNFAKHIEREHGRVDVLVNNAAVLVWNEIYPSYEVAKMTIDNNYKSLLLIEEYIYPLLKNGARVVNMCSAAGTLSNIRNIKWIKVLKDKDLTVEMINQFVDDYLESVKDGRFNKDDFVDDGKQAAFRVSKIALAALSMMQAKKYEFRNISINLLHPGHVKTDMAKGGGKKELDDGAEGVLSLIFDAAPNLSGTFMWEDGNFIDWYDERGNLYLSGLW